MKEFTLQDNYNNYLHTYMFDDVTFIKGVVQLLHGINEHGLRYKDFAEFLNSKGYIVYIHDYVSQGLSRTEVDNTRNTVYFGKKGNDVLVDGINTIRERIKTDFPNTDIYLFGHSLGSILARMYLIKHQNQYKKIILNGASYDSLKGINTAILLGNIMKLYKRTKPSSFFDQQFRKTQYRMNEVTTINHFIEWLTRDKDYTKKNLKDKFLYIRLSVSAFVDLFKAYKTINNKNNILNMNLDVPILLLSGTHDASTNFSEGTTDLHNLFIAAGFNSTIITYEEGRHDTLQEINRETVYQDIIDFMEGQQ